LILLVTLQVILWCVIGIPLGIFHFLRGAVPLMPRWLYMLLDLAIHALLGMAIGAALCNRKYACEIQKYRGAFYFLLAILFGYLYYAFFFGISFFLVSFVLAIMELMGLLVASLNFLHVTKSSALFSFVGCLWALYRVFLAFFAFFGF
jgi:hypothetical protein